MSVLFVCDHIFKIKDGKVYSNGFSYAFFQEYLSVFHSVTVVSRSMEVEDVGGTALASGDGVEFIFLESISTLGSFFGLRKQYREFFNRLMEHHDSVIVRLPSELGLLAADVAHKREKKCLLEVVGCAWDALWNYGSLKAKIYAPFLYSRMKMVVQQSKFVVYETEKFLQSRYPRSKSAMSLSIPDVRLGMMDDQVLDERIKKISSQGNKIVFGTIASLHTQYKGVDTALKALWKLDKSEGVDFEYRIIGEGNIEKYERLVEKYALEGKVFFDGTMPKGEAVFEWLDHLDVYLQPSLAEALSRSLIEAMSRGCPAIGSDAGGIPELLDRKFIFHVKNVDHMNETMLKLISHKALMKSQAEQNFNRVRGYQGTRLAKKRRKIWLMLKDH